ncbi:MAG: type 4a pilus biogenesis protein PilO [Lautropia mirabilis]|nr:type 4a pilus biogenesis protein PilO [Lautropia mirabilis]
MKNIELDFAGLTKQFEGLNGRHPGLWPIAPKALLLTGVVAAIVVGGWFAYWSGLNEELESIAAQEQVLKDEYTQKVAKAVNLDDLRRQKVLAEQYVGVLEKQLPSRAEMDALLSDINQAGVGRGAQLQLFRPGSVELKKHYAELPIAVKVVGGFHDLASFSSDLANLPRIVTLNNITIEHRNGGNLEMSATAKTFRYLDKDELARQSAGGQK